MKEQAKYVCDKKNKRNGDYVDTLAAAGKPTIMITLGNKTRVVGSFLLIQDSLRSMSSLRYYAVEKGGVFYDMLLNITEWRQMAEFEAVMRRGCTMCYDVQSDRVEVACEMIFLLSSLKMHYEENIEYDVVDTSLSWPADTAFADFPRVKMTRRTKQQFVCRFC